VTYDREMLDLYENMVEERHRIWLLRQNQEQPPWTTDPILRNLKMTNMFRVLDPGSQFVLTDLLTDHPRDFLARCVFYRITNLPSTWRAIKNTFGRYPGEKDFKEYGHVLAQFLDSYRAAGNKIFSGAYIIIPNPGVAGSDKMVDALGLVKYFMAEKAEDFLFADTQEKRYHILRSTKGIGRFLAMQILTDWGYGQPVNREDEFIVAGPGATRGAAHLNPDVPAETTIKDLAFRIWWDNPLVQINGWGLGLMNTQNTLCEFSKYVRETIAPRKVTPYKPAHPGYQEKPVLPIWMR
jgi:hypothetical protein